MTYILHTYLRFHITSDKVYEISRIDPRKVYVIAEYIIVCIFYRIPVPTAALRRRHKNCEVSYINELFHPLMEDINTHY